MNPLQVRYVKKKNYQATHYIIRHNLFTYKDNAKINHYAMQMIL